MNTNQTLKFSKYADKADISVQGSSGHGGSSSYFRNDITRVILYPIYSYDYAQPHYNYQCMKPWALPFGTEVINVGLSFKNITNNENDLTNNTLKSPCCGGNRALCNYNNSNNIILTNKNFNLIFPNIHIKNVNLSSTGGISYQNGWLNYTIVYERELNVNINIRNTEAAATGGSVTGFGLTVTGGKGGGQSTLYSINGTSYGTGPNSGYPGQNIRYHSYYYCFTNNSEFGTVFSYRFNATLESGNSCQGRIWMNNFRYK